MTDMLNKKLYTIYNVLFQPKFKKNKIIDGCWLPVINTAQLLSANTKLSKEAIEVYSKFQAFLNVNTYFQQPEALQDFIVSSLEKEVNNPIINTEQTSTCLTDNISFVPFTQGKKNFLFIWFPNRVFLVDSHLVFVLELTVPLEEFIDKLHTIYYISPCSNNKEPFISYHTDFLFSEKIEFRHNAFYCKSCNKKVSFVL